MTKYFLDVPFLYITLWLSQHTPGSSVSTPAFFVVCIVCLWGLILFCRVFGILFLWVGTRGCLLFLWTIEIACLSGSFLCLRVSTITSFRGSLLFLRVSTLASFRGSLLFLRVSTVASFRGSLLFLRLSTVTSFRGSLLFLRFSTPLCRLPFSSSYVQLCFLSGQGVGWT